MKTVRLKGFKKLTFWGYVPEPVPTKEEFKFKMGRYGQKKYFAI